MMLSQEQLTTFQRDGFLHLQGIFTQAEAARVRIQAEALYAKKGDGPFDLDDDPKFGGNRQAIFHRFSQLRWVLFHRPLVDALIGLLGRNFVLMPSDVILKSWYSDWHRDTNSPMYDGEDFFAVPGHCPVQVAIYMQENDSTGGGLDVVPGSHHEVHRLLRLARITSIAKSAGPLRHHLARVESQLLSLRQRLAERAHRAYAIPTKPGDVVIFDFGIAHRATPRSANAGSDKFALFYSCTRNNASADLYYAYLRDKKARDRINHYHFDEEMRAMARSAGFQLR